MYTVCNWVTRWLYNVICNWMVLTRSYPLRRDSNRVHPRGRHKELPSEWWWNGVTMTLGWPYYALIYIYMYWLVVFTILKNISQWEGLSHILWKITHVCNHPPTSIYWTFQVKNSWTGDAKTMSFFGCGLRSTSKYNYGTLFEQFDMF